MEKTVLDYDKLVSDYEESLVSKLRGFGQNFGFLELWVHDEDDTLSLTGMIESAHASKSSGFSIQMSAETAKRLDFDKVREYVKGFATVSVEDAADKKLVGVMIQ